MGIVVYDLPAATEYFHALALELQGQGPVEGRWLERIVGLENVRADVAMLQTPDGHGRLELTTFHTPTDEGGDTDAPANRSGLRHLAYVVGDLNAVVEGLHARGTALVGRVEDYQDDYRLCYVRGPKGIIIELIEQLR